MTRCACKGAELSCIIGNIFTELRPPCDMCGGEAVTIHGITPTGHEATIIAIAPRAGLLLYRPRLDRGGGHKPPA